MIPSPLAQAVGDLDEQTAVTLVEEKLAKGEAALSILEELQAGMSVVGERFEGGEYYLSELIYAADIFKKAGAPLQEELKSAAPATSGTLVLGTVKNDIHDFGKDIVATVMSSNGIKVVDLGVNVEHQAFVTAIREHSPQLVGMSCLLTTVFDDMKEAIQTIKEAGLRDQVKILIGGGPVDEATREYVGADYYCRTAQDGVVVAKQILGVE
ncbi:MAG: cobalamin-binding protein [Actinobacteria bacterium]|jgi:methanogenic corrinoid protein MtbC1|nr:cobalamin-binding protein [Actinomycetota bacterium]